MSTSNSNIPDGVKHSIGIIGVLEEALAAGKTKITFYKNQAVSAIMDAIDGKSWEQILGKTIGTLLDTVLFRGLSEIDRISKIKNYTGRFLFDFTGGACYLLNLVIKYLFQMLN